MIQKKQNEVYEKMEQKVKHNRNKNNISNHNINNEISQKEDKIEK